MQIQEDKDWRRRDSGWNRSEWVARFIHFLSLFQFINLKHRVHYFQPFSLHPLANHLPILFTFLYNFKIFNWRSARRSSALIKLFEFEFTLSSQFEEGLLSLSRHFSDLVKLIERVWVELESQIQTSWGVEIELVLFVVVTHNCVVEETPSDLENSGWYFERVRELGGEWEARPKFERESEVVVDESEKNPLCLDDFLSCLGVVLDCEARVKKASGRFVIVDEVLLEGELGPEKETLSDHINNISDFANFFVEFAWQIECSWYLDLMVGLLLTLNWKILLP